MTLPSSKVWSNFKYHWIDTMMTVVLWALGGLATQIGPYNRFFLECDPALSYPEKVTVAIPTWLLFLLCLLGPSAVILASQILLRRRNKNVHNTHKVADFFLAQAVLFQALGLNLFLTSTLKAFFGRQRPNFFAMCNYHGYAQAVNSGDFTEYFSLVKCHTPGNIANCRADTAAVNEARFSHPSGHASMMFAGMGFLSFFLFHLLLSHRPTQRNHMWKAIVFFVPLFIAGIVAATRTRDYWHNFDDTLFGSCLGLSCAVTVFYINYSRGTSMNVEYIGDLFPKNEGSPLQSGENDRLSVNESSGILGPRMNSPNTRASAVV